MKPIPLTATQIRELDEIRADQNALTATFNVAMVYHSNKHSELVKLEAAWWKDIVSTHGLTGPSYETTEVEGELCVVERPLI